MPNDDETGTRRSALGRVVQKTAGDGRTEIVTHVLSSTSELERRQAFLDHYRRVPIPDNELLSNMGLFLNRQTLSRLLFLHEIYRAALDVHGVIMEFGVRWGRDLVAFSTFRGTYEPYNYMRKIIGFDTFAGFPSTGEADQAGMAQAGDYSVTEGYEDYLRAILDFHESESPLGHIEKYELVKGDAIETVPAYLQQHPETIISLAYFDMDVYAPTKACLDAIRPHLVKGSVIGFDEVGYAEFPGETKALMEAFDLNRCKLRRSSFAPGPCYMVLD